MSMNTLDNIRQTPGKRIGEGADHTQAHRQSPAKGRERTEPMLQPSTEALSSHPRKRRRPSVEVRGVQYFPLVEAGRQRHVTASIGAPAGHSWRARDSVAGATGGHAPRAGRPRGGGMGRGRGGSGRGCVTRQDKRTYAIPHKATYSSMPSRPPPKPRTYLRRSEYPTAQRAQQSRCSQRCRRRCRCCPRYLSALVSRRRPCR